MVLAPRMQLVAPWVVARVDEVATLHVAPALVVPFADDPAVFIKLLQKAAHRRGLHGRAQEGQTVL